MRQQGAEKRAGLASDDWDGAIASGLGDTDGSPRGRLRLGCTAELLVQPIAGAGPRFLTFALGSIRRYCSQ